MKKAVLLVDILGVYEAQGFTSWLEMSGIPYVEAPVRGTEGTHCYCDGEAEEALLKAVGRADAQVVSYFKGKGIVGAFVLSDNLAVHHHCGLRAGAFELQEHAFAAVLVRNVELLAVGAVSTAVACVVHKVGCVPGVGKVDNLLLAAACASAGKAAPASAAGRAGGREVPGFIHRDYLACVHRG